MKSLFSGNAAPGAAPAPAPSPASGGWNGMSGGLKLGLLGLTVLGVVGVVLLPDLNGDKPAAKLQNQDPLPPSPVHDYAPLSPQDGMRQASANMGDMGRAPPRHRRRVVEDGAPLALYSGSDTPAAPAPQQATPATSAAAAPGAPMVTAAASDGAAHAVQLLHPSYTIRAGSSLPCLPVEANDSSRAGYVTCRVPIWVRSDDQRRGVLPPHTTIVGEIREGMSQFQRRLGVVYTKIEAPHFTMTFPGVGADAMGRAGENADIQTFFWDRAGAVALYALMDVGVGTGQNLASAGLSRAVAGGGYANTVQFGAATQSLAGEELQSRINRPPVAMRDQALPITIQVGQDLDFYDACRLAAQVDPMACPLQ